MNHCSYLVLKSESQYSLPIQFNTPEIYDDFCESTFLNFNSERYPDDSHLATNLSLSLQPLPTFKHRTPLQ